MLTSVEVNRFTQYLYGYINIYPFCGMMNPTSRVLKARKIFYNFTLHSTSILLFTNQTFIIKGDTENLKE